MSERRKKGTGTISKQKDGTYIVRLKRGKKPNGKPYEKSRRAKTQAEAKRKLKELQEEFLLEEESGLKPYQNISINRFFTDFLNNKRVSISDTSYRRLESTINTHIMPFIKNVCLQDITGDMIQERLENAMKSGLSYSSVKKIFDAFNNSMKYAIACGYIQPQKNPMLTVNMIAQSKFEKNSAGPRYLKNDEMDNERKRFVDEALRKHKNGKYVYRYGPTMVFMMNTGLRESEMSALSYETIDIDKRYLEVKDSAAVVKINGHYKLVVRTNETKWDSGRYVPLNDRAFEMLTEMARIFDSSKYVITTVHGTVLPPLELTKTFKRICKSANITDNMDGVGAHCLRHTFATSLFEQGVDAKVISELLGHSSTNVTLNTYISVINRLKVEAVKLPMI